MPEEREDREDMAPDFQHHAKDPLPFLDADGAKARLILGTAWGERAPVTMQIEIFYADVVLAPGAQFPMPDDHEDRGLYITDGSIEIAGEAFDAGRMMVFRPGDRISIRAGKRGARLMALGGETLNGPRHIWWNFVSSSRERLEEARQ